MDNNEQGFDQSQVVEPLSGSSVVVEPKENGNMPDNGFPIGYGPNAHMKKIEKPKKPSISERLKHTRKKLTKKQKILVITIPSAVILLIVGFIVYASITGLFKTDYSGTYFAAKELRNEIQKVRSDASCDKAVEYVSNQYTANDTYNDYINECRAVAEGVSEAVLNKVGDTAGVLKDEEARRRFEVLKSALLIAKDENEEVKDVLKKYSIWHEWVREETSGDTKYGDGWPDVDLKKASAILIDSGVKEYKEYGEKWYTLKKAVADASNAYYHPAPSMIIADLHQNLKLKQEEFDKFKKENALDVTDMFLLELVDTTKLYVKFEEFYNYVRDVYQENYNRVVGGCKEYVTSVVCE